MLNLKKAFLGFALQLILSSDSSGVLSATLDHRRMLLCGLTQPANIETTTFSLFYLPSSCQSVNYRASSPPTFFFPRKTIEYHFNHRNCQSSSIIHVYLYNYTYITCIIIHILTYKRFVLKTFEILNYTYSINFIHILFKLSP